MDRERRSPASFISSNGRWGRRRDGYQVLFLTGTLAWFSLNWALSYHAIESIYSCRRECCNGKLQMLRDGDLCCGDGYAPQGQDANVLIEKQPNT